MGSWPHAVPEKWSISPWAADWYRLQPWESQDDKGFYYHAQQRRYGGDLQGVIDKLDYLAALGINAIYFTPLFQSPSAHKYDATMYHHIDKNFGSDPEGDVRIWATENPAMPMTWKWTAADKMFLKLIQEAHRRNIRIIIDGVFNHVGMTFWAFEDVKRNQRQSSCKDWFTIKTWDDPATPVDEFDYQGWFGVRELPELRKDNPEVREHIKAIVHRWMDPNGDGDPSDGIDGWRLDAADKVPLSFWREFRSWVRGINPEAYLVGEVWWEDWKNDKMYDAAPWLKGDVFDAVMNYRWAREVCHYFVDKKDKISVSEFDRRLAALRSDYPKDVNYVLLNLLDSHDTDRSPSRIVNPDLKYGHGATLKDNPDFDIRKPTADEIRVQKLMILFQMTYPGAPMIYYGDEAGMWGASDPDDRKPMLWDGTNYEDETAHPLGKFRPRDRNEFNEDLFNYYKMLAAMRREYEALSIGKFATLVTDDQKDVYAFLRSNSRGNAVVVINNSAVPQSVTVNLGRKASSQEWSSLLDSSVVPEIDNALRLKLERKSAIILVDGSR